MKPYPLLLASLLLLLPLAHADASQTTILFDDFTASTLSPIWTLNPGANLANITQTSGYLAITSNRYATSNQVQIAGSVLANNTGPIIDSNSNNSFIMLTVKMLPFNLTTIPIGGIDRYAETDIGFVSTGGGGFGIQIYEQDSTGIGYGWGGYKSAVGLVFAKPNQGGGGSIHCFTNPGKSVFSTCSPNQPPITYTPATFNNPFDLNTQHTFTLMMRLWQGTDAQNGQKSWVAMQIDNNAWINQSQTACLCISPPGTNFASLYPVIGLSYCVTSTGSLCNKNQQSNQSVAVNVDYVLITNYAPSILPAGQLLVSNTRPPTTIPNPYNAFGRSDSLVGFMQFQANSIAPGNIYAGGLLLTGFIVTIISGILGAIIYRTRRGIREMGFMWSLSSLGIVFFNFYCGIIPLWLPAVQTVLCAGIIFGIVKSGPVSGGGVVPD